MLARATSRTPSAAVSAVAAPLQDLHSAAMYLTGPGPGADTDPSAFLGVVAIIVLGTLLLVAAAWVDSRRRR